MKKLPYQLLCYLLLIIGQINPSLSTEREYHSKLKKLDNDIVSRSRMIDVNNIGMWVLPNGIFANDPPTGHSGLEYPLGSGHYAIYTAGLILGAMVEDSLHIFVNSFVSDCTPGAIGPDRVPYGKDDPAFHVYKIENNDTLQPGSDYLRWPVDQGAPVDSNGNPLLIGDQTLWCCFTDGYGISSESLSTRTAPLGAEVHMTVFAWQKVENIIFIFWEIINKSTSVWDSAFVGVFCDPDLGEATDDMVASDSLLLLSYCYNGQDHDPYYGNNPPAIGFTFLQTPVIHSVGDTTMLLGRLLADHISLPARSPLIYKHEIEGEWGEKFYDAKGKKSAYLRMQGLSEKSQPMIDPTTGNITQWAFSGDPVLGSGWINPWPPRDSRFLLSSGPFNVAPGDTQMVGIAIVAGQGNDRFESIIDLKFHTQKAVFLYKNYFPIIGELPQPMVDVGQFDREIILSWDTQSSSYCSRKLKGFGGSRYEFEGYNVYEGETEQGPWHRIAVFDRDNNVRIIYDYAFSEELGYATEIKVAEGTDSGVQHYIDLEQDCQGKRLVNGRRYYYAVTAYAYNPNGIPKVIETDKELIVAIPQFPLLNTEYNADIGDSVQVEHQGSSDARCQIRVIDPSKLTGHEYRVKFYPLGADNSEEWRWQLTDLTTSTDVITNQTNFSGDEAYPVIDGFQVKVFGPTKADYGINVNVGRYGSYGAPYGGFDYEGSCYITGVDWGGASFYGGMDIGEKFYGSTLGPFDYVNVQIDFWSEWRYGSDPDNYPWSKAYVHRRDKGCQFEAMGDFPGAAYDVEDPEHPRRLNICFLEDGRDSLGIANLRWDPVACSRADIPIGGYEVLFIMKSDYDPTGGSYPADAAPFLNDGRWGPGADVLYVIWAEQRGSYTGDEEFSFYIYCNHLISTDDTFTFSTKAPTVSSSIARSRINEINVFPNPYCAFNKAETNPYRHFVTFSHLPPECTIRIFSLSGQMVKTILHDDGTGFEQWNLSNDSYPKVPVASGMYIAHIEVPNVGVRILKLAVVMPRESFILLE